MAQEYREGGSQKPLLAMLPCLQNYPSQFIPVSSSWKEWFGGFVVFCLLVTCDPGQAETLHWVEFLGIQL